VSPGQSLVDDFGEVADDLRQLATDFGARAQRVVSVRVRWSGGGPGRGTASVVWERELLPTPDVRIYDLVSEAKSAGRVEAGLVRLRGVSPQYSESEIDTLCHLEPLAEGEEGWLELRSDPRDGQAPIRRRLAIFGVPYRDVTGCQWILSGKVSPAGARGADGKLTTETDHPERGPNLLTGES
jgi:hypothetical protein